MVKMSDFFEQNRLTQDKCALMTKELQNRSVIDYNMFNMYPSSSCCANDEMLDFTINNPNLHYRDGYGNVSGCTVNMDSELRNNAKMTNFREKEQLCTRWYQGCPNIGKGGLIPNIESRLHTGEDTLDIKECDIIAEKNFDRFIPMLGCLAKSVQDPSNIILPFARGGDITRDFIKDDEYLKHCGFVNDGKLWRRVN